MASELTKTKQTSVVKVSEVNDRHEMESSGVTTPTIPDITPLDGSSTIPRNHSPYAVPTRHSSVGDIVISPRIIVTDSEAASDESPLLSPDTRAWVSPTQSMERDRPIPSIEYSDQPSLHVQGKSGINMAYNEWGELLRSMTGELFIPEDDLVKEGWTAIHDGHRVWTGPMTVWDWNFKSDQIAEALTSPGITTDKRRLASADKPPRVLEVGCGDGHWCFRLKKDNPTWVVHAVDNAAYWTSILRDAESRDFMEPRTKTQDQEQDDYFGETGQPHQYPEFTVRNLNSLRAHERPIPQNSYGLIRGRDFCDKIRNLKAFVEDLRQILEPGGVVEFAEIDPRPRYEPISSQREIKEDAQSRDSRNIEYNHPRGSNTVIDWNAGAGNRLQNPTDVQLVEGKKLAPGWADRVKKRMEAGMRPFDEAPAARLKSWLQGGGFWDVHETIMRLPVGGDTRTGQLIMNFIKYQASELEDQVPKLKEALAPIDFERLPSLDLFLNCHIITGRNPHEGRMGDLRDDGQRESMTEATYDSMERFVKFNHWRRATPLQYHLDGKLSEMIGHISSLHGGPDHISPDLASTGKTPGAASANDVGHPNGMSNLSARASEA
ncbi:hypothetical protein PVAG01_00596 [Phlyctema vagabunda]|uniref:Methyltransferase domain-containing protein n=1 Tax=Phlyctema vagabunda TaxID=108571 RepID=A0ABR4PVA4_9HELO